MPINDPRIYHMFPYYLKRAFTILQKEGVIALTQEITNYIIYNADIKSKIFTYNTKKNAYLNRIWYESPPDPYSRLYVHSSKVKYKNRRFSIPNTGLGKIRGGNWDSDNYLTPIRNDEKMSGIIKKFQHDKEWEETSYYSVITNKRRYNTDHRVREKLRFVENLYEEINTHGYKRADRTENIRESCGFRNHTEVLVNIDRNGKIHHAGEGKHRLSIAKVLDITIPVQVLVRHEQWQEIRDEIYTNGFSNRFDEDLRDHPDLQDVLD